MEEVGTLPLKIFGPGLAVLLHEGFPGEIVGQTFQLGNVILDLEACSDVLQRDVPFADVGSRTSLLPYPREIGEAEAVAAAGVEDLLAKAGRFGALAGR